MSVIVAADEPHGSRIAAALVDEGVEVAALVRAFDLTEAVNDPTSRVWESLRTAEAIVLHATRSVLVPDVIAMCDRSGTRIVAVADRGAEKRAVLAFGLAAALPLAAEGPELRSAVESFSFGEDRRPGVDPVRGTVTVVWGPDGAPGRTTVALALAASLTLAGRRVALVDADTHAPSIAQRLDLSDETPGFAAACRQTDYGVLDGPELTRLSAPVSFGENALEVLTGINRPSRWPELSTGRVVAALDVARDWADHVIVDVGAPLEVDEEITSDVDGPRRNQAALAALAAADRVLAVASADPVGISRFVRGAARLDEIAPASPRIDAVNRMRSSPFGVDASNQVRRTLGRFAGSEGIWLLPDDPRAADRALLAARPILPGRRGAFARAIGRLGATL